MTGVITGIMIVAIWGICIITDIRDKKRQKQEYLNQAEYWSMRGERENADMYYRAAARLK